MVSRASIRDSRKQAVVQFTGDDFKKNTLMVPTNEEINYKVDLNFLVVSAKTIDRKIDFLRMLRVLKVILVRISRKNFRKTSKYCKFK